MAGIFTQKQQSGSLSCLKTGGHSKNVYDNKNQIQDDITNLSSWRPSVLMTVKRP
jgi:hypothetical protein